MALYSRLRLIKYRAKIWYKKNERYRFYVLAFAIGLVLVLGYGRIY